MLIVTERLLVFRVRSPILIDPNNRKMSSTDTAAEKLPGNQQAYADEKYTADHNGTCGQDRRQSVIRNTKSPGVARIEAVSSVMTRIDRVFIFFGVFLVAYGELRFHFS